MIRPYSSELALLSRILDALLIWFGLGCLIELFGVRAGSGYTNAALLATAFFLFLAETQAIYISWRLVSIKRMSLKVLLVWFSIVILLVGIAFLTKTSASFSRRVMLSWFVLVPFLMILQRVFMQLVMRALRKHGMNTRTVAIAGAGESALKIVKGIFESDWMGLKFVGIYDDRSELRLPLVGGKNLEISGNLRELVLEAKSGRIDYVYIALPMKAESRIVEIVNALADTTASVYVVPDFFIFDLMHARWFNVGGVPMVSIFESPFFGVDGWSKRLEDIVFGTLIMILIAIPMLIIAVGVKLSSPGPVIFKQRRYGLNGKVVEVWKFRSMKVCEDGGHVPQARKNDPRITPFGAFLRRTSLDELPQFINVLQGHMSIVGPRPHAISHNEQYRRLIHGYMLRHKVKPGITGWAQINGWRGETDTLEKMTARIECDLHYIQNWSLWMDVKIIFLTVFKGFVGKQAY
ncbi:MAG: undecaprenyl-phosphate glucose phosphotransferase [Burkholderiales bacterium]|nr:undecaprenyl-phosphate glucose phosphotransferase [Burkholderiales bacterium]